MNLRMFITSFGKLDKLIEKNILYDIIIYDKYFTERMNRYEK